MIIKMYKILFGGKFISKNKLRIYLFMLKKNWTWKVFRSIRFYKHSKFLKMCYQNVKAK